MGFTAAFSNEVRGSSYAFKSARSEGASKQAVMRRKDLSCWFNRGGDLEGCSGWVNVHSGIRSGASAVKGDNKLEIPGRLREALRWVIHYTGGRFTQS